MVADAAGTADGWLLELEKALASGDPTTVAALFLENGIWRDLVAFTWNIKTVEGREAIAAMLRSQLPEVRPTHFKRDGEAETKGDAVEAWFTFETAVARGRGRLRLLGDKVETLLTTMTELIGHEERRGPTREAGVAHGATRDRITWTEMRAAESRELGHSRQPYVVIIGGGQGGIALAARLKRLQVPTIVVEKNASAGDSWRNRYHSLVLHDPVWYDHLPYIPFPDHWPVFTPKDKMGDWLEMYVKTMELDYWTSTECIGATFDADSKKWSVRVRRDHEDIALRPHHLVFATGSYGPPNEVRLPGAESFTGDQYHSSRHLTAAPYRGSRCVVVGANSSAHDIAVDFWEHDADVTMIQRSPTTVVRSQTLLELGFEELYSESALARGITTDAADLLFAAKPFRLMAKSQAELYARIAERDADLIHRLNAAGFHTDYGPDKSGLMMKALRTGSGYYIDVGASELICSGAVKVLGLTEPVAIRERSVVLANGVEIPADVIVYATGYRPMNAWVADIVSPEAAALVGPNWGYGSGFKGDPGPWEGELRNMWKPLRHDAMWFHGGNLHLSRHYSLYVALQLKARLEGISTPVYEA